VERSRRGASACSSTQSEEERVVLADAAKPAAERASRSIDEALDFIEASNRRIAALEAKAARDRKGAAR
jgi:hypothetical protein